VSNFYFSQQDGYFAKSSEYLPLLHTWSLAVEEQFYLIFPILLLWIKRKSFSGHKNTAFILLCIALGSFIINLFGVALFKFSNFFLIPGRAWELLLGGLLAYANKNLSVKTLHGELLAWISCLTLFACALLYNNSINFPGVAALPVCLATAIIIFVNSRSQTSLGRLLSLKPFVYVGKISYSLYLWHWPIFVFSKYASTGDLSTIHFIIMLIASFIMAVLSYHFIEQPIRKGALSDRHLISGMIGFTLSCIAIGVVCYKSDGLESRFNKDVLQYANASNQSLKIRSSKMTLPIPDNNGEVIPLLLWGDSHAAHIAPALNQLCADKGKKIHLITEAGAPPFINSRTTKYPDLAETNKNVIDFIKSESIKHVILVGRWDYYYNEMVRLENLDYPEEKGQSAYKISFDQTVEKLLQLGTTVWIMKQVPHQRLDPPRILANAIRYKIEKEPNGISLKEHIEMQTIANEVIDNLIKPGVRILESDSYFFSKGSSASLLSQNGNSLYRDSDHLSPQGAKFLIPIFEPIFYLVKQ